MLIKFDTIETNIAKGLAPLYVITSDEHLLAQEAADAIRQAARKQNYTEREVLTVDRYFKWDKLNESAQSMSLFGDKKILELRIPTGKPGKEGAQALQEFSQQSSQDVLTIISLPQLDWQTKKAAWVSTLQKHAVYVDIPLLERRELPHWINTRLARQKHKVSMETLDFLVNCVEGNLLAAHQEIQKLALLYPEGELTQEQVQNSVLNVARYDVFKLNEAVLTGDTARLMRMLDGLKGEGTALPRILWAIAEEIRTLIKLTIGLNFGKPFGLLCKEYRIWGPRERLLGNALRRLNLKTLQEAEQQAAQIDKIIKGLHIDNQINDAWNLIEQLTLKLAKS